MSTPFKHVPRTLAVFGLLAQSPGPAVAGPPADAPPGGLRTFTSLDVFQLEAPADPQISPDGLRVAYVRRSNDIYSDRVRSSIWTIDLRSGEHEPLVVGAGSYTSPRWSPRGDRLLYLAAEDRAPPQLRVLSLRDRGVLPLTRGAEAVQQPAWSPDGRSIAFMRFVRRPWPAPVTPPPKPEGAEWAPGALRFDALQIHLDGQGRLPPGSPHVFVVSASGGTARDLTSDDIQPAHAQWLDARRLVVCASSRPERDPDQKATDIFTIDVGTGVRTALRLHDGPDNDAMPSPDGRHIAFLGYDDRHVSWQTTHLYVMTSDGSGVRNLTEGYDRPVRSPRWHPDGESVLVLGEDGGRTHLLQFGLSGGMRVLARDVGDGFRGRPYSGGAFDIGGPRRKPVIVYSQESWHHPAELALLDERGAAKQLTDLNGDVLGDITLASVEAMKVPSIVDGRIIDAWIARPPGVDPTRTYPMILEIHGGPHNMYGAPFASEFQRYAAEGFVVVWANPRGSAGYGEEFVHITDRRFPGEDYDDLMSVVDAALAKGSIDPRRLFVTGGSGGGALTAWTVGKTRRFAAAAAVNPVINWTTIMLHGDTPERVARYRLRTYPWDDLALFWRSSPLSLAGNVRTPTLLIVGQDDWRAPPVEATQFYTALKLQGVEARLLIVPGATHDLSARPSHHAVKTDNVIEWFRMHDPERQPAPR